MKNYEPDADYLALQAKLKAQGTRLAKVRALPALRPCAASTGLLCLPCAAGLSDMPGGAGSEQAETRPNRLSGVL
eukprot:SAG31_NODE_264_length_18835_cov_7.543553_3_plen_75_part_00